jgi:hypothetical protein
MMMMREDVMEDNDDNRRDYTGGIMFMVRE